jgi:hypothetical protein
MRQEHQLHGVPLNPRDRGIKGLFDRGMLLFSR